jgi:hypothetical protein
VLNLTALKQPDSETLREAFSRSGDKLRITVTQAKWLGDILARLNDQQIEVAFRAGNYSPAEIQMLTTTVRARINELVNLRE